ncbi:hypothetical protein MtrunA17_Chr6g0472391 [Medicago truncatula]|uniref:Uncharacterized protein n=1 Tax=Medicago truncatula TaxID=3880 RepID=A0A396HEJ7_MEDTR|nr:hypothetical protein MtrunA17_Chr6g0472391 [Medicago truncatula]
MGVDKDVRGVFVESGDCAGEDRYWSEKGEGILVELTVVGWGRDWDVEVNADDGAAVLEETVGWWCCVRRSAR